MQRSKRLRAVRRPTTLLAACLLIASLTGCADKPPPVVSGDLSCDRFRHISATQAQIDLIRVNYDLMESWVDQVVAHNATYDAACAAPPPPSKTFGGPK